MVLEGPLREKSIVEELAMPNEAGTWGMADAPAGIVGLKQIFWATKGPAASLVCCEARLVMLFETFVPVARLSSICTVLAIAAARNHCTSQIDMESAYTEKLLTSDEVISMKRPPGLSNSNPFGKIFVCCPRKIFYDFKQSRRWCYQRLVRVMIGGMT